jgi:HEAT repeat protein
MPRLATHVFLRLLLAALLFAASALAQDNPQPAPDGATFQTITIVKPPEPSEILQRSWQLLTDSVQDAKHFETRTQALNALSSLGSNSRAVAMIAAAMKDTNLDVRSAAVVAAGKARSRSLIEPVKKLLNDPEPQVVFIAATTLWKEFRDRSGEDILAAVAAGDRRANPNLIHGARHDMSRTMHSPAALEKIGITTAAGMLLGPFGFSVTAVEYMRKNGADTARVRAIELLEDEKTEDVRAAMRNALDDKDPGVRAAAVKVLGDFHRQQDSSVIAPLLDDTKLPVRLAAAAAYINIRGRAQAMK